MSNSLTTTTTALSFMPSSFGEVEQFANLMAKSTFIPKHLRGNPANCIAVVLQALRWEMDPFTVGQKTFFTAEGSPPGYEAQLIIAVLNTRAPLEGRLHLDFEGDGEALVCTVTGKMRGDDRPKVKRCALKTITTRNSPLWKQDVQQQLGYYTMRAWARLYCPEVILGVYENTEIECPTIDVTPAAGAGDPVMARVLEKVDPETGEVFIEQPAATSPAQPRDHVGSELGLPPAPPFPTPMLRDEFLENYRFFKRAGDQDGYKRYFRALSAQQREMADDVRKDAVMAAEEVGE